jgi:cold shock CspA family protein
MRTSAPAVDLRADFHGGSKMGVQTGTVKTFNSLSGHGMIVADETGNALWVHQRNVLSDSPALSEGDRVEYENRDGGMGPEAVNVRFLTLG